MKIIDLTIPLENGMEVYPGDPPVKIKQIHFLEKEGWGLRLLSLGSHTGTHVDTPAHMDENGKNLDNLPIEKFIGKAQVVQINNNFPKKIGLVFSEGKVDSSLLDKILEAQAPFIVIGKNVEFPIAMERALLQKEILTFVNLINLELLPKQKNFTFFGIPLKIKGGDGSPIRAFAVLE